MSLARPAARRGASLAGSLAGSLANGGRLSSPLVNGARLSRPPVPGARLTRSIGSSGALPNEGGGILPDSSSSPYKKAVNQFLSKLKPSEGTVLAIGLLTGIGSIFSGVYMGYHCLEDRVAARAKAHIDTIFAAEKKERELFQRVATAAHHDFMGKSNESTAQIHREMACLRSEMMALQQKEFKHRQELIIAAKLLQRYNVEGVEQTGQVPGNE